MRLLGRIIVFGAEKPLRQFLAISQIPDGKMEICGAKRKIAVPDLWLYSSPWYAFAPETLDEDLRSFITANWNGSLDLSQYQGIEFAALCLCPVGQDDAGGLATLFSPHTLKALCQAQLSLEIAPALVMPEVMAWPLS